MQVLIVESNPDLAANWARHLERLGAQVWIASGQPEAAEALQARPVQIIVLNLVLAEGSAFAVADLASYRWPGARVIFVTNTTFFSDGSIFQHIPNACAFVPLETAPEDLAAMVEHHARKANG